MVQAESEHVMDAKAVAVRLLYWALLRLIPLPPLHHAAGLH